MTKQTVLLVDNKESSLQSLELALKQAGYEVMVAHDGVRALGMLEATREQESLPDVVVAAMKLRRLDGHALVKAMKEDDVLEQIPVIFITEGKAIEDKIRGMELGVQEYLNKPVRRRALVSRVRSVLAQRVHERLSYGGLDEHVEGNIADIAVADLLESLESGGFEGVVRFATDGDREAVVHFADGVIVDAKHHNLRAEEAVFRVLCWSRGTFAAAAGLVERERVIEMPTAELLAEGLRYTAEYNALVERLPALDAAMEIDSGELLARMHEIPEELTKVVDLCDGKHDIWAILDESPFDDLSTLLTLSQLYEEKLLVVVPEGPTDLYDSTASRRSVAGTREAYEQAEGDDEESPASADDDDEAGEDSLESDLESEDGAAAKHPGDEPAEDATDLDEEAGLEEDVPTDDAQDEKADLEARSEDEAPEPEADRAQEEPTDEKQSASGQPNKALLKTQVLTTAQPTKAFDDAVEPRLDQADKLADQPAKEAAPAPAPARPQPSRKRSKAKAGRGRHKRRRRVSMLGLAAYQNEAQQESVTDRGVAEMGEEQAAPAKSSTPPPSSKPSPARTPSSEPPPSSDPVPSSAPASSDPVPSSEPASSDRAPSSKPKPSSETKGSSRREVPVSGGSARPPSGDVNLAMDHSQKPLSESGISQGFFNSLPPPSPPSEEPLFMSSDDYRAPSLTPEQLQRQKSIQKVVVVMLGVVLALIVLAAVMPKGKSELSEQQPAPPPTTTSETTAATSAAAPASATASAAPSASSSSKSEEPAGEDEEKEEDPDLAKILRHDGPLPTDEDAAKKAYAALSAGRFDKAIALAKAAIKKDPTDGDAYMTLAWSYENKGMRKNMAFVKKVCANRATKGRHRGYCGPKR